MSRPTRNPVRSIQELQLTLVGMFLRNIFQLLFAETLSRLMLLFQLISLPGIEITQAHCQDATRDGNIEATMTWELWCFRLDPPAQSQWKMSM